MSETTSEAQYVERDGQLMVRPPYLQSDAFLMAWLVRGDKAALQRQVDIALHLPCVFLKQFRSATSPNGAAYQAIVEANATIKKVGGAGVVLAPWQLRFWQYASHRVIDSLGVAATSTQPLSMWVDFTFSMDLGRVLWKAP